MMSVNKNDYKVVQLPDGYVVKKRACWIFWKTVRWFDSKRKAHAYINFLK
jgi:hypothetical protein